MAYTSDDSDYESEVMRELAKLKKLLDDVKELSTSRIYVSQYGWKLIRMILPASDEDSPGEHPFGKLDGIEVFIDRVNVPSHSDHFFTKNQDGTFNDEGSIFTHFKAFLLDEDNPPPRG